MKSLDKRFETFLTDVPEEVHQEVYEKDKDGRLRPSKSFKSLLDDVENLYKKEKTARSNYSRVARKLAESLHHNAERKVFGKYHEMLEEAEIEYNNVISELDKGQETVAYVAFMILYRMTASEKKRLNAWSNNSGNMAQIEIDLLRNKELVLLKALKEAQQALGESISDDISEKELIQLRQKALAVHDYSREIRLVRKDILIKMDAASLQGAEIPLSEEVMSDDLEAFSKEKVNTFKRLNQMKMELTLFLRTNDTETPNLKDSFIIKTKRESLEKDIRSWDEESQAVLAVF